LFSPLSLYVPPRLAGEEESMTRRAVELLRAAAQELRQAEGASLFIPLPEPEDPPYPMGLEPGDYEGREVAEAVQFLADLLEE
jgi:hypothetical protein